MSGHSKWATTKHKKAVIDARRGKMFARLIKNIEVAARVGGGDPAGNPTLYDAIQKAKKSSVPNENIERARKRGAGEEAGGADWQNITYEGYGPNGVAVLIECLTDNRNRAAGEVRVAMTRNGGNMADPGSVAYLFSRKGVVVAGEGRADRGRRAGRGAGRRRRGRHRPRRQPSRSSASPTIWSRCARALQDAGIDYDSAEAGFQPSVTVPLDADGARKMMRLVDALEDSDDVQDVYTNADIPDEVMAELDEEPLAEIHVMQARTRTLSARREFRCNRVRRRGRWRRQRRRRVARSLPEDVGQPVKVSSNNCSALTEAARARHGSRSRVDPLRLVADRKPAAVGRSSHWTSTWCARPPTCRCTGGCSTISDAVEYWMDTHRPDVIAIERVFSQQNVSTVMGTAQAGGVIALAAARRDIDVHFHTPSEVKAAVTGNGGAGKAQVTAMVTKILALQAKPTPADAADALALAICHCWRAPMLARMAQAEALAAEQRKKFEAKVKAAR